MWYSFKLRVTDSLRKYRSVPPICFCAFCLLPLFLVAGIHTSAGSAGFTAMITRSKHSHITRQILTSGWLGGWREVQRAVQVRCGQSIIFHHILRLKLSISVRDSRFSRLGTETPRLSVWVSSWNQTRYPNSGLRSLGVSLGSETQIIKVSESEPESWFK